jgi:hypothetical protein
MSKATLATIPNTQDTDTLLEITLEQNSEGKPLVALRRLSWNESLGWYPQQPFQLSPEEAEALLQSLRSTRQLWQTQQPRTPGKVVPFPTLLTQETQQHSRKTRSRHKK